MKLDDGDGNHKQAPRSKFVQQMRQIKMERLRPMNCFAKAPNKFTHHDLIEKSRLKKDAADPPCKKDSEGCGPWPPAGPGALSQLCFVRVAGVGDPGYHSISPAPPL